MDFTTKPNKTKKEKEFINKGSDNPVISYHMFQLRMPLDLISQIDERRKDYPGIASRTQVIIDILEEYFNSK